MKTQTTTTKVNDWLDIVVITAAPAQPKKVVTEITLETSYEDDFALIEAEEKEQALNRLVEARGHGFEPDPDESN